MPTQNKRLFKFQGFTLIELIVVITILAILGTIAFVNFNGYSSSARDSVRMSDLSNMSKSLSVYKTTSGTLPLPTDYTDVIDASGSLLYQGLMGDSVLNVIGFNKGLKDPLDGSRYSYSISADKNNYQIGNYMENINSVALLNGGIRGNGIVGGIDSVYAIDYLNRYFNTRGDTVGIILNDNTNAPIYSGATIDGVSYTGVLNLSGNGRNYRVKISNSANGSLSGSGGEIGEWINYNYIKGPYPKSVIFKYGLSGLLQLPVKTTDKEYSITVPPNTVFVNISIDPTKGDDVFFINSTLWGSGTFIKTYLNTGSTNITEVTIENISYLGKKNTYKIKILK